MTTILTLATQIGDPLRVRILNAGNAADIDRVNVTHKELMSVALLRAVELLKDTECHLEGSTFNPHICEDIQDFLTELGKEMA